MTANFDKLREIFLASLEQAPDQRNAYLDQHCAGDEALRRSLGVMLKAHAAEEGPSTEARCETGKPEPTSKPAKHPAASSAPTSSWNKSAKAAWVWCSWPSYKSQ
jgi:hypothetical protein